MDVQTAEAFEARAAEAERRLAAIEARINSGWINKHTCLLSCCCNAKPKTRPSCHMVHRLCAGPASASKTPSVEALQELKALLLTAKAEQLTLEAEHSEVGKCRFF